MVGNHGGRRCTGAFSHWNLGRVAFRNISLLHAVAYSEELVCVPFRRRADPGGEGSCSADLRSTDTCRTCSFDTDSIACVQRTETQRYGFCTECTG